MPQWRHRIYCPRQRRQGNLTTLRTRDRSHRTTFLILSSSSSSSSHPTPPYLLHYLCRQSHIELLNSNQERQRSRCCCRAVADGKQRGGSFLQQSAEQTGKFLTCFRNYLSLFGIGNPKRKLSIPPLDNSGGVLRVEFLNMFAQEKRRMLLLKD